VIEVRGLTKIYPPNTVALRDLSLTIPDGQFVTVIGPSGAGKSSLLRCLNGLVAPTAGEILVDGQSLTRATGEPRRRLRARIGFVFQQFNLIKRLPVLDNVLVGRLCHVPEIPSLFGLFPRRDRSLAEAALARVGLAELADRRADTLSGGQQQRVAIARALVQEPRIILADEPMASLDPSLSRTVMDLLRRINEEDGITVLTTLHVMDLALAYGQRVIGLRDGRVVYDGSPAGVTARVAGGIFEGEER
jgi:phosphonate transport system ATP-binding protein